MANAGPQGDVRVLAHKYQFEVSDAWIQDRIDEEGIEPPKIWRMAFQLRELPDAESRKRARRLRAAWESIPGRMKLPEPTEDPIKFLDLVEEWVELEAESAQDADSEELAERQREVHEQEAFEAEMAEWIGNHGSDRLKLAHSRGYKIVSSYAKERGRADLPGCWIDTAGRAEYRERVDPSMEALDTETKVQNWLDIHELDLLTRIIWLVTPPSSQVEHWEAQEEEFFEIGDFRQQEALLLPAFLGKYGAYLPVDKDERAPVVADEDPRNED
jgi:hypothetical protein